MEADAPSMSTVSSPGTESTMAFELEMDLGAFELISSGVSPVTLMSQEEPVIMYHANMPVHSVHHDTVGTETALESLLNAPESMLTGDIPPTMVADNYCFVVDGERVKMGDIMGDDQWWRHTSRPTKYYYSEDLRKFQKVNVITAKGRVIAAKLGTASASLTPSMSGVQLSTHPTTTSTGSASASTTPRSSVSFDHPSSSSSATSGTLRDRVGSASSVGRGHSAGRARPKAGMLRSGSRELKNRGEDVPVSRVYKVIRFYSFWKTCTAFHRIVTMIEQANGDAMTTSVSSASGSAQTPPPQPFRKRLFVQYLWRNAKTLEKARVQKEFDPRRQRLLRFVTDPANRKKVFQL